jgi:hypothetical protein
MTADDRAAEVSDAASGGDQARLDLLNQRIKSYRRPHRDCPRGRMRA